MSKPIKTLVFGGFAIAVALSATANAQVGGSGFEPFDRFLQRVSGAKVAAMAATPGAKVSDPAEFEGIRNHILSLYQGIEVSHSFVADGQYFDCVKLTQQPTLRALGLKSLASPPPRPPASAKTGPFGPGGALQAAVDQSGAFKGLDSFGNARACEAGRFPMRRVTLEEIARFGTLRQFLQKGPGDVGQVKPPGALPGAAVRTNMRMPHKTSPTTEGRPASTSGVRASALRQPLRT